MKRILLASSFFLIIFVACTPIIDKTEESVLRSVFNQYVLVSQDSNIVQSKYFTDNMWNVLQESRSQLANKNNASVNAINNFPNELAVENSVESRDDDKGCLIVQGTNQSGASMDYVIEFVLQNTHWVFSDVTVTLYDTGQKRWLTEPICDTEKQQLFWLEHQHKE